MVQVNIIIVTSALWDSFVVLIGRKEGVELERLRGRGRKRGRGRGRKREKGFQGGR